MKFAKSGCLFAYPPSLPSPFSILQVITMVGLRNSPFNFTIRQPSPTTTSYTVSNAPARHTRLTQLLHPITILTRIVLAAVCTVYLIWESGVSTLCAALLDRATGFQINVETPWLVRWVKICTGQVSEGTSKNGLGTWAVLGICAMLLWTSSRRSHIGTVMGTGMWHPQAKLTTTITLSMQRNPCF